MDLESARHVEHFDMSKCYVTAAKEIYQRGEDIRFSKSRELVGVFLLKSLKYAPDLYIRQRGHFLVDLGTHRVDFFVFNLNST